MDVQSLETQIREKLPTFRTKARRVAEYILGRPSELACQSISEVAETLAVSKAQLVRMARVLGFDGYPDLRNAVIREMLAQTAPSSPAANNMGDDASIPQELCRLEQANLEETLRKLSPEAIVAFCEAAKNASAIHCMGWGISSLVAEWFYTRFTELGLKAVLMRRGSLSLMEQARGIAATDMLIVCELPSYVIEVAEAVEQVAQRGAFVVTLTDSPAAPICAHSGLRLYVSDQSPTFGSSLLGPMFAVHVLTSVLAYNMGEEGQRALAAQKEGLSDQRVYYPAYGLRY